MKTRLLTRSNALVLSFLLFVLTFHALSQHVYDVTTLKKIF